MTEPTPETTAHSASCITSQHQPRASLSHIPSPIARLYIGHEALAIRIVTLGARRHSAAHLPSSSCANQKVHPACSMLDIVPCGFLSKRNVPVPTVFSLHMLHMSSTSCVCFL